MTRTAPSLPDYHLHTPLCRHAKGAAAEYLARAESAGLPEIAFADHAPNPDGYDSASRMSLDQVPQYLAAVAGARRQGAPEVRLGLEIDFYPGCERFLRPWLPALGLDLVLGSIHYIGSWNFDHPAERAAWDATDVTAAWRAYFRLLGGLVETRLADVVAHLDLPKKFGHRPPDRDLADMAAPVLDRIAAAGMAVEINTSGLRKPVREIYPSALLLALARERGIPVCFGSDAHQPEEVGWRFDAGLALAREAGYAQAVRFRGRRAEAYALPGAA
jgi:histidinol-phosphatase (PHP family)